MAKIRICYYDDGNVMNVERVHQFAESFCSVDSICINLTEAEADELMNDYHYALSTLYKLKSYRND